MRENPRRIPTPASNSAATDAGFWKIRALTWAIPRRSFWTHLCLVQSLGCTGMVAIPDDFASHTVWGHRPVLPERWFPVDGPTHSSSSRRTYSEWRSAPPRGRTSNMLASVAPSGLEPEYPKVADFKSAASANSAKGPRVAIVVSAVREASVVCKIRPCGPDASGAASHGSCTISVEIEIRFQLT